MDTRIMDRYGNKVWIKRECSFARWLLARWRIAYAWTDSVGICLKYNVSAEDLTFMVNFIIEQ